MNILMIPLVLLVVFFLGAAGFGVWAFMERQEYKNNSDAKVDAAVVVAKKEVSIEKDRAFAEAEKLPLTSHDGPGAYGSVHIEYPKTWSVYVNSRVTGNSPYDAYFNPQFVPSISDEASVFAVRVKVLPNAYAQVVKTFEPQLKKGEITSTPYALPKVPGVVGVRLDGQVIQQKKDLRSSMVIFPMRDKTLQIWSENAQLLNDYNSIILQNMTFSP